MAVEGAVGSEAGIVADLALIALYLVGDVEPVGIHETVFDAQVGVVHIVEMHLDPQVASFDAENRVGFQLVQDLLAVRLVRPVTVHSHR